MAYNDAPHFQQFPLKGNLAKKSGLLKKSPDAPTHFSGMATIFETVEAFESTIKSGQYQPGDALVACGMPGTDLSSIAALIYDQSMAGKVAIITDGFFGDHGYGLNAERLSPNGDEDGFLSYLMDGDIITIDAKFGMIDVELSNNDLDKRRAAHNKS